MGRVVVEHYGSVEDVSELDVTASMWSGERRHESDPVQQGRLGRTILAAFSSSLVLSIAGVLLATFYRPAKQ